jgi:hypothetical protein
MAAVGFGNEPVGRGPRGLRADQPPPSTADDLHAIRARYCGPPTNVPQPFSFTANGGQRFDLTGTAVNQIILTTMSGQVNGYFGDNSSQFGRAALLPHFVGTASIAPNTEVIPVPPSEGWIFSLQEGAGSTATGTITFCYV